MFSLPDIYISLEVTKTNLHNLRMTMGTVYICILF